MLNCDLDKYRVDLDKVVSFDLETIGFDSKSDEILQISLIDGNGNILLNSYVKPYRKTEWKYAQQVHGISPETVKNAPYLHTLLPLVRKIFNDAALIVSYNGGFDIRFLIAAGIDLSCKEHFDVMRHFASQYNQGKVQKLVSCAQYFGYNFNAHDSLEDAKATLFCFKKIIS
ncbi:MAG: 3'-5' exonuclease [Clostridia bacterium]|nr:3'-5' exonuclease [Clostridia bacterium]